ncbi:transmembrane domain protein MFS family sugar transporter [Cryptosporidium ryanae]|uniref:transmembrane domain protein MFS family sugar transporter n=1 Tax=Cryptosporidium ryanae TaxID=515981 RepID=UPI00351A47FB|nr:transmembrane domain protein MFS family sugar transporter [Cryptosporidium ryanae]
MDKLEIDSEYKKPLNEDSVITKKLPKKLLVKSKKSINANKYSFTSDSVSSIELYETTEIRRLQNIAIRSIAIVCLAASLDGCDEQLLPASLRALEVDLKLTPKDLGNIILCQILCLAMSCPIWGLLADRYSRKYILATGVTAWGFVTILLSFSSFYWEVLITRAINGAFLGSVGPLAQSVLADTLSSKNRGFGFGMIQLSSCIGRVFGAVLTTSVSQKLIAGFQGWRFAFLLVGLLSATLGGIIVLFMDEIPHLHLNRVRRAMTISSETGTTDISDHEYSEQHEQDEFSITLATRPDTGGIESDTQSVHSSLSLESRREELLSLANTNIFLSHEGDDELLDTLSEDISTIQFTKNIITQSLVVKSVILMIFEGISGTIPWSSLTFMTMYLQYCDLSNFQAAVLVAMMFLGSMLGGPLGGLMGDYLNNITEDHGRPLVGQISMAIRIPIMCILFLVVPKEASSIYYFLLLSFLLGFFAIAGAASSRPILSDVVRASHRATVFSIAVLFEGISAATFGAPVVGILSENVFGYKASFKNVNQMDPESRLRNANALSNSLVFLTVFPWCISLLLYSLLHFTYGNDKRALKKELSELAARSRSVRNRSRSDEFDTISTAS